MRFLLALGVLVITAPAQAQVDRSCATTTVVTGGTAVTVVTGPVTGGWLVNPLLAADQGIATAEAITIDEVGAATAAANETTTALQPGQSYGFHPSSNASHAITINAPTSGHRVACERY